jgi:arylsulfatase A-like enzyme
MNYLRDRPQPEKPFCCVVSVEPPHPPYEAPPELEGKWLQRELDLPPNFLALSDDDLRINNVRQVSQEEREAVLRQRQIYYAMVENLDQNVGRINAFLKEQGLDENTIIVFLSDHGEMGGAQGLRNKQLPYEESAGIPLIASGAGIPAGRVIDAPTCTEDIFPTLCGLAEISPRDALPGDDLSPFIRGEKNHLNRDGVMLEFVMELRPAMQLFNQSWRAFRSQRYKYTVIGGNEGMQPWQFFDLENDPYELTNLIGSAEHESLIRQHHQWLRDRMTETGDHAWLARAFEIEPLNAWVDCHIGG